MRKFCKNKTKSHYWPIYFIVSTLKNLSFILSSIHITQIFFYFILLFPQHTTHIFSFILLFPHMKVLWYFALFSKGKVPHLFTWCSHIIWKFLTFVAPSTYRKCCTWIGSVVHGWAKCTLMGQQRISMNVGMMDTCEMSPMTLLVYALESRSPVHMFASPWTWTHTREPHYQQFLIQPITRLHGLDVSIIQEHTFMVLKTKIIK